jgi:hypothetical protein
MEKAGGQLDARGFIRRLASLASQLTRIHWRREIFGMMGFVNHNSAHLREDTNRIYLIQQHLARQLR